MFRTLLTKDRPGVDLRGDHIGDPCREVRFDRTRNNVYRWTLRSRDQVNARGTRHLCKSLNTALNFLAGNHHEVCHLVDYNNNVRNMICRQNF